jgi:hypothetical protein
MRRLSWILLLAASACNQRGSIDTPVTPTPQVALPPIPTFQPNQPEISTVNLVHWAVFAGDSVRGVVNLYARAQGSGATVTLASSDSAVQVPATVTVPPGEVRTEFTITTRPGSDDRQVVITAKTQTLSAKAALAVFGELPNFFWYSSDPGEFVGAGESERLSPLYAELSAECEGNEVRIAVEAPEPDSWSLVFSAPAGLPLKTGTYEGVTSIMASGSNAKMSISGRGRACDELTGRFTIREVDVQNDRVNRFRVTFDQQCRDGGGWLHGDARVTNMAPSGTRCPS